MFEDEKDYKLYRIGDSQKSFLIDVNYAMLREFVCTPEHPVIHIFYETFTSICRSKTQKRVFRHRRTGVSQRDQWIANFENKVEIE